MVVTDYANAEDYSRFYMKLPTNRTEIAFFDETSRPSSHLDDRWGKHSRKRLNSVCGRASKRPDFTLDLLRSWDGVRTICYNSSSPTLVIAIKSHCVLLVQWKHLAV